MKQDVLEALVEADAQSYSIPYCLIFDKELDGLVTGIFQENAEIYMPKVIAGQVVPRDMWSYPESMVSGNLESSVKWTVRWLALLFGMIDFSSNYSMAFAHRVQVAYDGNGDGITPGPGFDELRFEDPFSGRVYLAWRKAGDLETRWLAAELIDEANRLVGANAEDYEIQNVVQDLEMMRGMFMLFGYVY